MGLNKFTNSVFAEICKFTDVMKNATDIPDSAITSNINTPDVKNVRPGSTKPWNAPVPQSAADRKPEVTVDVTPSGESNPTIVESIVVTGNVKTVTVLVQETENGPFKEVRGMFEFRVNNYPWTYHHRM